MLDVPETDRIDVVYEYLSVDLKTWHSQVTPTIPNNDSVSQITPFS